VTNFNSRQGGRRYKLSDEEAYERLPVGLKRVLQDSLTEWSSNWVLRSWKRDGVRATIDALRYADECLMLEGFVPGRRKHDLPKLMSTYIAAGVSPLRLYDVDELVRMVEGEPSPQSEVSEEEPRVQVQNSKGKMRWVKDDGGRAAAGYKGQAGDCVCRAIAIATGKPYSEVYDALFAGLRDYAENHRDRVARHIARGGGRTGTTPRNGVSRKVFDKYLASLGWKFTPTMKVGSGCKVHLRADELPSGRLIVKVSKHVTAVIDGVVHDTHDPSRKGTRCVYGYFSKEGE
jgi:hypothetical protein